MFNVILSIYNKEKPLYLRKSLQSLSDQTLLADKVVIVFDGAISVELSSIVYQWKEKYPKQVVIIKLPNNEGLAPALNLALKQCNTEFIARVDTDDINVRTRFERQIDFLVKNINVDVVGSYISEIDENGNTIKDCVKFPLSHDDCLKFFSRRDPLAHPSVMFKKSFFDKAGGYSEKHVYPFNYEDTILWFQGFKNNCVFANIPEVLLNFRRTQDFYNRRSGYVKSLNFFRDRLQICDELKFDFKAKVFSFFYFLIAISPSFIKKIAYKLLR